MSAAVLRGLDQRSSEQVVAIILGGGRGTRLFPLTRERAKPAVPLGGRYRLVDIPLSNCINSGINRIFVLTQFNSRSLHRHINETYKFDVFSRGFVEVLAAEQTMTSGDWFQGTADAIRQNLWHLRSADCDHYLILSGDHLYRMDYRDFFLRHIDTGADISVSTIPVTREAAKGFGIMKVEPNGLISEFVEKPQTDEELEHLKMPPQVMADFGHEAHDGREYLASMGVYLFRREVLKKLLEERREWIDFGKHVIPESLATHRVHTYLFNGFWEDIGTVQSFYDVSMRLLEADPPFRFLEPGKPIYSRPRYLPGSTVGDASISASLICEGSNIEGAHIEHSIIGIRSIIGSGVHIKDSIMMGADFYGDSHPEGNIPIGIANNCVIEHAIVDKNACIGEGCIIRGREGLPRVVEDNYAIIDGIVIILKNASIPPGTVIG